MPQKTKKQKLKSASKHHRSQPAPIVRTHDSDHAPKLEKTVSAFTFTRTGNTQTPTKTNNDDSFKYVKSDLLRTVIYASVSVSILIILSLTLR